MAKLFDSPAMRETLRRTVRAQMAYRGMEYRDLSRALEGLGVQQSAGNLRTKVNTGALGAQLFVYILLALDAKTLDLGHTRDLLEDVRTELDAREHP
ncbi:MAG: DUF6471 domain-containing protein [Pseudomonadota bacterium]